MIEYGNDRAYPICNHHWKFWLPNPGLYLIKVESETNGGSIYWKKRNKKWFGLRALIRTSHNQIPYS